MASAKSLAGLMKWLDRDEWQGAFTELMDLHIGPACANADLSVEELSDLLGDHHTTVLWGCVFEDFLALDLDDGRNIVDDYLKRRGWNESATNKRYMSALRSSVISLYEISDIVRDQSFLARDLIRGGEPVRIAERSATRYLKPWDWMAARVVQMGPRNEMAGGALTFDRDTGGKLLDVLRLEKSDERVPASAPAKPDRTPQRGRLQKQFRIPKCCGIRLSSSPISGWKMPCSGCCIRLCRSFAIRTATNTSS